MMDSWPKKPEKQATLKVLFILSIVLILAKNIHL